MSDIDSTEPSEGWIDGWTEEEWEAFHNVPCPEPEETTIEFTFTCPPERSSLLGVPEGEQGVRLPPNPVPGTDDGTLTDGPHG